MQVLYHAVIAGLVLRGCPMPCSLHSLRLQSMQLVRRAHVLGSRPQLFVSSIRQAASPKGNWLPGRGSGSGVQVASLLLVASWLFLVSCVAHCSQRSLLGQCVHLWHLVRSQAYTRAMFCEAFGSSQVVLIEYRL